MWLAKVNVRKDDVEIPETATVTVDGDNPGVYTRSEERDAAVCSAGGYVWKPKAGERVLVVKCSDGTKAVIGRVGQVSDKKIQSGEVYIRSEKASVYLCSNGSVEINGDVNINGSLTVNGNKIE